MSVETASTFAPLAGNIRKQVRIKHLRGTNSHHVAERGEKLINPTNFLPYSGNLRRYRHLSTELCTTFVDNLEL